MALNDAVMREEVYERSPSDLPVKPEIGGGSPGAVADIIPLRGADGEFSEGALIQRAIQMYEHSTNYMESSVIVDWEDNIAHFSGKHGRRSRYMKEGFGRSNTFRPVTRKNVKAQEAGLATAMFSTTKLLNITPINPANEEQHVSAAISSELLQYHLEHRMPWATTVMGAYQDTKIYGLTISHQYWQNREYRHLDPASDENGNPMFDDLGLRLGEEKRRAREDKLCCDIVPPENFRFDPLSDWREVANKSPFLIYVKPMRVIDAEEMMERNGGPWKNRSRGQLVSSNVQAGDRVRQARYGYGRQDPADDFGDGMRTVFAHMNIVRENGEDWVYWTMGTQLLLTKPERLMDMHPWLRPGERPFVIGYSVIETHRTYPRGDVDQMSGLQTEINEVANQRIDNVRLALNNRFLLKRGARVDLNALMKNKPGAGIYADDPEGSIKQITTQDVTGSSYREQEVLSQEVDQLVGGFDVSKSAQDGGSPGGIARAGAAASKVQDYGAWLFVVTWVELVLGQLLRLMQMYETDEARIAVAAERSRVVDRFGIDQLTDELLTQELVIRVDAGIGTMDPLRRVDRLRTGIEIAAQLPEMVDRMKPMRIADEVFGALGYTSAEAFFDSDAEFEEKMANAPEPGPSEIDVKMRELDIREGDNQMRNEREQMKLQLDEMKESLIHERQERKAAEDRAFNAEKAMMDDQTKRDIAAGQVGVKNREADTKARQAAQNGGQRPT